ncbi:hypothetical protein M3484_23090 [Pseudomonas sp. GX19020]|uniref:hypothetical protein n=1 Tax=Pseudomonas sp. GX19020 TaxID=2942277 RepID=UPI002018E1FE|nr:hypothetical protein [Pseudomonas sp. GX19020]MCL4069447.1 hypothetical protein [Pseudomonas sp. GX19020]
MLIETQKNRNHFAPDTPALPFRAELLPPRRPSACSHMGEADCQQAAVETVFDAPETGFVFRWIRTVSSGVPSVHPLSGPESVDKWWYIADAAPGSWLQLGLKQPCTAEQLRAALVENNLPALLRKIEPAVGDMFVVEAGTVHALGPGLTIVEIARGNDDAIPLTATDAAQLAQISQQTTLVPSPIASLPGDHLPFRIACEMLGPEQRVMLMDSLATVAIVEGSGTFGNRPYEAGQCWQFNGPLTTRAIEPTVLIVAERCEPDPDRANMWRIRS